MSNGDEVGDAAILAGIKPMSAPPMSDLIAEEIKRLVIAEGLHEGARLPSERELAERFGVSRPTVSQAVRRLALMGMVEIRRGSGAYITRRPQAMVTASVSLMLDLDKDSISELAEARLWLETLGVEHAARREEPLPAEETSALRDSLQRLGDASGSASRWIAADTVFHAAVVATAGNSYLTSLYESVHTAVLSYEFAEWLRSDVEPPWIASTTREAQLALHKPILTAVLQRKPAMARAAVFNHHEVMMRHLISASGTKPV
ncbi:MAG TPA: FadR/GntR family transcriptional regulator [Jatrophihabitans sp.]|jgi:GntR family transcriptional repressor for pyruvate dehydrogenase complex